LSSFLVISVQIMIVRRWQNCSSVFSAWSTK